MEILGTIDQSLTPYQGKSIYFEPLGGNHGDKLIEYGSLSYFKRHGFKFAENPERAELIAINGGGAMNDIWKSGISTVKKYIDRYPDIPLVILPSSFSFEETDFPAILYPHKAPITIFSREKYSLQLLKKLNFSDNIQFGLDHDMAFHLKNTSFIENLKRYSSSKHILIVERQDAESATINFSASSNQTIRKNGKSSEEKLVSWIRDPISHHVVTPLRQRFQWNRGRLGEGTSFYKSSYKKVLADYPQFQELPIYAADVSSTKYFTFNQFSRLVAESAVVVTTRLHVAILAAMLNKPTYLKGGSYHKIKGVFEYSLKDRDDMIFIE